MGKQVDYPADTVGADGTVYPTVGENIRNIFKGQRYFYINYTFNKVDGVKNVKSNLKITYDKTHVFINKKNHFISVDIQINDTENFGVYSPRDTVKLFTSNEKFQFDNGTTSDKTLIINIRGFYYE